MNLNYKKGKRKRKGNSYPGLNVVYKVARGCQSQISCKVQVSLFPGHATPTLLP